MSLTEIKDLTSKNIELVRVEVSKMNFEEVKALWISIEPFWPGVCARVTHRSKDLEWFLLQRKMQIVRNAAENSEAR